MGYNDCKAYASTLPLLRAATWASIVAAQSSSLTWFASHRRPPSVKVAFLGPSLPQPLKILLSFEVTQPIIVLILVFVWPLVCCMLSGPLSALSADCKTHRCKTRSNSQWRCKIRRSLHLLWNHGSSSYHPTSKNVGGQDPFLSLVRSSEFCGASRLAIGEVMAPDLPIPP